MSAPALFGLAQINARRPRKPLDRGKAKPTWTKYNPKKPQRCDDCQQVALESLQHDEPFPGIANARQSRRQDGITRLYCYPHADQQKQDDRREYGITFRG